MMRGYFDGFDRFSRVGYGMFGGQFMWVGMLVHLLLIVGFILFIVWLVKKLANPKQIHMDSSNAIEIIKERYAKGEITKEEFENLRKDLR
jgi:putative membrane protein